MSSNNARAVAETLEAKKKEVVEDGLSVARILKKNVIAINKHLQEEDAMVVDEVHSKTRENQAKLEAEALALKKVVGTGGGWNEATKANVRLHLADDHCCGASLPRYLKLSRLQRKF